MPDNVGTAQPANTASRQNTIEIGGHLMSAPSSSSGDSGNLISTSKSNSSGSSASTANANPVTPLKCRAGNVPVQQSSLYANSPKIRIYSFSNGLVNTFNNFILTDVQEQAAEKIDVIETFGVPHLFASGRFMRRYTFQGQVRTTPVNDQSGDKKYYVPASSQLRDFYEQWMRASVQAQNQWYTDVWVDGEDYEGFVTTFNMTRNSQIDTVAQFVFSLVAFRMTPKYDTTSTLVANGQPANAVSSGSGAGTTAQNADALSGSSSGSTALATLTNESDTGAGTPGMPGMTFLAPTGTNPSTVYQGAKARSVDSNDYVQAEINNASANVPIDISPRTLNGGIIYQNQQIAFKTRQIVSLTGNQEQLLVSSSYPGIDLIYQSSTQGAPLSVHGSTIPQGVMSPITYRITNYVALFNALSEPSSQALSTPILVQANSVTGIIPITISTRSGQQVVLHVKLTLNTPGVEQEIVPAVVAGAVPTVSVFNAISFVDAIWQPVLSAPDSKTGVPTRLDRLGYLSFLLTTVDNTKPSSTAMAALAISSLSFKTLFSSDVGTMNLSAVPLSGNAYGTGRVGQIQLQTSLASITWTKNGLQLMIELDAFHTSDNAAKYYTARFWNYLSTVIAASVSIPASTGIGMPAPWRK